MASDKTLTCRDCGTNFTFTASEQDFFATKGFTNEPGRCPACREARKNSRDGGSRSTYSSGGGYSGMGGGERREREMFSVICSQCGKNAQVPFQPRGDKPVYCSDCFRSRQTVGDRR